MNYSIYYCIPNEPKSSAKYSREKYFLHPSEANFNQTACKLNCEQLKKAICPSSENR